VCGAGVLWYESDVYHSNRKMDSHKTKSSRNCVEKLDKPKTRGVNRFEKTSIAIVLRALLIL
jgi:hypothetical protein